MNTAISKIGWKKPGGNGKSYEIEYDERASCAADLALGAKENYPTIVFSDTDGNKTSFHLSEVDWLIECLKEIKAQTKPDERLILGNQYGR